MDEFRRLSPNMDLLESLASATGGRIVKADELEKFAADLPKEDAPEKRTIAASLWHTPFVFLLVLLCFAIEWILRRRQGMA